MFIDKLNVEMKVRENRGRFIEVSNDPMIQLNSRSMSFLEGSLSRLRSTYSASTSLDSFNCAFHLDIR